jgi:Protein of unknown function (DUF3489)
LHAGAQTKIQLCVALLSRRNGATLDELIATTGWQAHSCRGFLSGTVKKKLGLALAVDKRSDGARQYRIVPATAKAS